MRLATPTDDGNSSPSNHDWCEVAKYTHDPAETFVKGSPEDSRGCGVDAESSEQRNAEEEEAEKVRASSV